MKEIIKDGLIENDFGSIDWSVDSDLLTVDDDGNEIYSDDYIHINNLFVRPEFRGQGKARELMTRAIEKIQHDYRGMTIKIVPEPKENCVDFEKLANFYLSFGIEVVAY